MDLCIPEHVPAPPAWNSCCRNQTTLKKSKVNQSVVEALHAQVWKQNAQLDQNNLNNENALNFKMKWNYYWARSPYSSRVRVHSKCCELRTVLKFIKHTRLVIQRYYPAAFKKYFTRDKCCLYEVSKQKPLRWQTISSQQNTSNISMRSPSFSSLYALKLLRMW